MKSIAERAFGYYLKQKGYSEFSENGNPSTVYNYPQRVMSICKDEGFSTLDEFSIHIIEMLEKYGEGGEKESKGAESHGSNLKALKLFAEFVVEI